MAPIYITYGLPYTLRITLRQRILNIESIKGITWDKALPRDTLVLEQLRDLN